MNFVKAFNRCCLVVASLLLCGSNAHAAIIVAWDTDGLTGWGANPFNATGVGANVTNTAPLARGSGITTGGTPPDDVYGGTGFTTTSVDAAGAIAANEFFTLSADANDGFAVSYSSIAATFRRSSTGPNGFQWQYDIGGGFVNIGSAFSYTGTDTNGLAQASVDLTGITDLQNLQTAATFRLLAFGATSGAGSFGIGRLAGDDLVFDGTVSAIPEPSSLLLVGAASAVFCGHRLTRRKSIGFRADA